MTSKFIEGHKSSSNFSINPTLPNTFVYVLVLMEIYINDILCICKYFIYISMTSKGIEGSPNFSINPTLPNTFIYESILRKIYMNANIMNMQIFLLYKYDLKGY